MSSRFRDLLGFSHHQRARVTETRSDAVIYYTLTGLRVGVRFWPFSAGRNLDVNDYTQ